jgi:hypothetical protein
VYKRQDRATVIGNKCLNIKDSVDFTRKIYQRITSSTYIPLTDGKYKLSAKVKSGSVFNTLYMYALSNNVTFKTDITYSDSQWHNIEIKDVLIKGGIVEIGFMADGAALAWCRIDDVTLIKTGELVEETAIGDIPYTEEFPLKIEYFSFTGMKLNELQKGLNVIRKTYTNYTTTNKIYNK